LDGDSGVMYMEKTKKLIPEISPGREFIFGYLDAQKPFSPTMFGFVLDSYKRTLRKNTPFSLLFKYLSFRPTTEARYIFVGGKYADLMRGLPREEVLVIGLFNDWLHCLRHRIPFASGLPVLRAVLKNVDNAEYLVDSTLHGILPLPGDRTRYVILFNDSLPLERTYCLLAKEKGLRTACVQHGVFTSASPPRVYDGGIADLMLVFDEHQRRLLVEGGVPADKVRIIGFHSDMTRTESLAAGRKRRVCILGQPWGAYYPEIETRYHALLERVIPALKQAGLNLAFKPHPSEQAAPYLDRYEPIERASLERCLGKYDVFISFTSTALIEATLAGRVAIQIFDPAFMADWFEDHRYAYSVERDDWERLIGLVCDAMPLNLSNDGRIAHRFLCAIAEPTRAVHEG
jgi:hypothetical protein